MLESTERKMLRIMWVTLRDSKSDDIRRELRVDNIINKVPLARLRWYVHLQREWVRRTGEVKKMWEMEVEGGRPRGRPHKRWVANIREDMKNKGLMLVRLKIETNGE